MSPRWRTAGLIAGLLGAAVGAAAKRSQTARLRRSSANGLPGPLELGMLPRGRESSVAADDGLPLSVEELAPADGGEPELTVVLVHGLALDRRCWHFQRSALAELTGPRVRLVLYDQRSHGRSGRAPRQTCTIDQLADDLAAVLRAVAPDGPLVLVGHSMGGMTIMALAERAPELYTERIAGVALLSTSAGEVGRAGLPGVLLSHRNPLVAGVGRLAGWRPGLVERGRRLGSGLARPLVRAYSYGDRDVSPVLVDLVERTIAATPVEVLTDFVPALSGHDRSAALAALSECEVLVAGGDADRLLPFGHSVAIAAVLPAAELLRLPGAGHLAMLEQPGAVTDALVRLLHRCTARRGGAPRLRKRA